MQRTEDHSSKAASSLALRMATRTRGAAAEQLPAGTKGIDEVPGADHELEQAERRADEGGKKDAAGAPWCLAGRIMMFRPS